MKHIVKGKVIRGEGIGKKDGYPTANLDHRYFNLHPIPSGVYAAWAKVGTKNHPSLVIIGVPFARRKNDFKIEVYLLNFKGDLRNTHLQAEIVKRLRPIRIYNDKTMLLKQIKEDIKQVKRILR